MKKLTLVLNLSLFIVMASQCFSASTDLLPRNVLGDPLSQSQHYKNLFIKKKSEEITFPHISDERKREYLERKIQNDTEKLGGTFIVHQSRRKKNILALSIITQAQDMSDHTHYLPYFYVQPVIFYPSSGFSEKRKAQILKIMIETYAKKNALGSHSFFIQVYDQSLATEAKKLGFTEVSNKKESRILDRFPNLQDPSLFPTLCYESSF